MASVTVRVAVRIAARAAASATAKTAAVMLLIPALGAQAHDLTAGNAGFIQGLNGSAAVPFIYLGAKHMFTGYDHLLFLLGVIFFLYKPRHVILYVTLFTLGHSSTLLLGVLAGWQVNPYLIDAIIGLSVVYKGFENMGGFAALGWQPDPRWAVTVFGLCHGLGLATRLQQYMSSDAGLLVNLLSFNLGVELGQLAALSLLLLLLHSWRQRASFDRSAFTLNAALMCAGMILFGSQTAGYLLL
jgi:hypothetical protein